MFYKFLLIISSMIFTLSASYAGGLSLGQSRVVFDKNNKSQVIQVNNSGDSPYLIQVSLYSDLEKPPVDDFVMTPPLFRVEANNQYAVRILPNGNDKLAKDKESLFYLKVRAMPPINKELEDKDKPGMVFVTAIVIKLINRPDEVKEPKKDDFMKVVLAKENNVLKFNNPTPYFMTMVGLELNGSTYGETILIPPFSQYPLKSKGEVIKASWNFLNDFGVNTDRFNYDATQVKTLKKKI